MNTDCIKQNLEQILTEERYSHTLGTAKCAYELAIKYNLDADKAYLAGLLHDCAKCKSNDELVDILKNELKVYDENEFLNYKTLHAKVGAHFAKEIYSVCDAEILSAIDCHTVGKLNMTTFDKVIYLADKIEENTRDIDYRNKILDILNSKSGEVGLDFALLECFSYTIKSLVDRKLKIAKTTIDVYNELLEKTK